MKMQNRLGGGNVMPPDWEDWYLKTMTQGLPGKFTPHGPAPSLTSIGVRGYPAMSFPGPLGMARPGMQIGPQPEPLRFDLQVAGGRHPLPPQRPPGLTEPFPVTAEANPPLPPAASAYAPTGGPPARPVAPPPAGQGAHPLPPERPPASPTPGMPPFGMASQNAADFSGLLAGAQTGPKMGLLDNMPQAGMDQMPQDPNLLAMLFPRLFG